MLKQQMTSSVKGMISAEEEEMSHLKEENKRDMHSLLKIKEETLPEHQEWNLGVDREDIKKEEKLWISQQGEECQQLEEADLSKFGLTVKSENHDENPESSQLRQSQSDDITEAEPVASSSSEHRTLTAEDDGGPQPVSNSGPNSHLQPDTSGWSSDSSGSETDDSYDWKQTTELQSHFNCQKNSKYGKASGHMNNSEQNKGRKASEKTFSCSDRSKRQKGALITCMISHMGQKPFGCSECGQRFGRKNNLNRHMIIHTGQRPFGCSECGKKFGLKSNLKAHMIIHSGIKQFDCSQCGRKFGLKRNLTRHMSIHTGQKQFVCPECGKKFGLKSNLNTHMIVHTGKKTFGCSECGQRFGRKSNLNTHMIIHSGKKPFTCSECGQRFGRKSNLNTHMIVHTGKKGFGCSECGQRFGQKGHLYTHMRIHTFSKKSITLKENTMFEITGWETGKTSRLSENFCCTNQQGHNKCKTDKQVVCTKHKPGYRNIAKDTIEAT